MNDNQQIELLSWICDQDRLRIETWHYMGGKKATSVWTAIDDEDTPSGKDPTAL